MLHGRDGYLLAGYRWPSRLPRLSCRVSARYDPPEAVGPGYTGPSVLTAGEGVEEVQPHSAQFRLYLFARIRNTVKKAQMSGTVPKPGD